MKRTVIILVIIGVALLVVSLLGPYYILTEGEQAVVVQFGRIVRVDTTAGVKYKVPFVENVVKFSKKVQSWDGDAQRIPTSENQFIWVDTTARWRISDAKKFYESVGSMTQAQGRMDDVIDSEVRKIVSRNPLRERCVTPMSSARSSGIPRLLALPGPLNPERSAPSRPCQKTSSTT